MWSQKLETQDPDDPKTGRVKKRERDRLRVWDADETFAQHARMAGWRGVDNVVILSVQSKRLCTCPFSEKQGSTASRTSMRQRPTCWIRISLPFRKVFQEQILRVLISKPIQSVALCTSFSYKIAGHRRRCMTFEVGKKLSSTAHGQKAHAALRPSDIHTPFQ